MTEQRNGVARQQPKGAAEERVEAPFLDLGCWADDGAFGVIEWPVHLRVYRRVAVPMLRHLAEIQTRDLRLVRGVGRRATQHWTHLLIA